MLVSKDWLKNNLGNLNLVILDTRPKTMYLFGHLPNSLNITLEQIIKFDKFSSNLVPDSDYASSFFGSLGIDNSKTVLVVGDSLDPSAARIAWTLLYFGHEKTFLLDTNISELPSQGFEFTKIPSKPTSRIFTPKVNTSIRIESEYLHENLSQFVILDARTPQEYMMGHLPNAKLLPYTDGLGLNGKLFQDGDSLKKIFMDKKISKNSEIVCYCMHGHRASSLFFQLLEAGYENVKLFDGSFVEWNGRGLPLE